MATLALATAGEGGKKERGREVLRQQLTAVVVVVVAEVVSFAGRHTPTVCTILALLCLCALGK